MLQMLMLPLGDYQTNCYMVSGDGDDCVLIDPGYQPDYLLEQVRRRGKSVAAILLTHGHFDHVGAVQALVAETGCDVYLHRADGAMEVAWLFPPLGKTLPLQEGQTLNLAGLEIRVLHTPGHTPGSVCFRFGDCLIAGDTLFAGSIGRTDFVGGDWNEMAQSLKRLMALEENCKVYSGHGNATTLEKEKKYNPYMK